MIDPFRLEIEEVNQIKRGLDWVQDIRFGYEEKFPNRHERPRRKGFIGEGKRSDLSSEARREPLPSPELPLGTVGRE